MEASEAVLDKTHNILPKDFRVHTCLDNWTLYYFFPREKNINYKEQIKELTDIYSFEELFAVYNSLPEKPGQLPLLCGYFIFKKGITPFKEDKANEGGYALKFQLSSLESHFEDEWMNVLLSAMGGDIKPYEKINGVEYLNRNEKTSIEVWIGKVSDEEREAITQKILEILKVKPFNCSFVPL